MATTPTGSTAFAIIAAILVAVGLPGFSAALPVGTTATGSTDSIDGGPGTLPLAGAVDRSGDPNARSERGPEAMADMLGFPAGLPSLDGLASWAAAGGGAWLSGGRAGSTVQGPPVRDVMGPTSSDSSEACQPHPPILIVGDEGPTGFVLGQDPLTGEPVYRPGSGVVAGNGTEEDPYILEGWCIAATSVPAIHLESTTAHVVIRDNHLFGLPRAGAISVQDAGIMIGSGDDSHAGHARNVRIEQNTITQTLVGVRLVPAGRDNVVRGNLLVDNWVGVLLEDTDGPNAVVANTIIGNGGAGILVGNASRSRIEGNNLSDNGVGLSIGASSQIIVRNNTLDHNGADVPFFFEPWGVSLSNVSDSRVVANTIRHTFNRGDGVRISDGGHDNRVRGNTIVENSRNGVRIVDSHRQFVENNVVASNSVGVHVIDGSRDNAISNNSLSKHSFAAVFIDQSHRNRVQDNQIADNDGDGVRLSTSSDNLILRNEVVRNNGSGIFAWISCKDEAFAENHLEANDQGMMLWSCDRALVHDNVLVENGDGINLLTSDDTEVRGNTILSSTGAGFDAHRSDNTTLRDNTIRGNGANGATLSVSRNGTIWNNSLVGNGASGLAIWSFSQANSVQGNVVVSNSGHGVYLSGSDGNVVAFNTIDRNGLDRPVWFEHPAGIRLQDASHNRLQSNALTGNEYGLVVSGDHAGNLIRGNNLDNSVQAGLLAFDANEPVDATYNWWDDATGPSGGVQDACVGTIADGGGEAIATEEAEVCFDPWFASPNPDAGTA